MAYLKSCVKLSACTITFRHSGWSLDQIVRFAAQQRFDGIELWGVHARAAAASPGYGADWLLEHGLRAVMLSDYLPLEGTGDELRAALAEQLALAARWGTPKLRVFAGSRSSAGSTTDHRQLVVERLRGACARAADVGVSVLVETHPRTLADTAEATLRLLADVDHPALGINFDVLHLWQGGDEPEQALARLAPQVWHFHLKNVRSRAELGVFEPENVFSAEGSRQGMVGLFEGELDYRAFLRVAAERSNAEASLEWFGADVEATLSRDRQAFAGLLGS